MDGEPVAGDPADELAVASEGDGAVGRVDVAVKVAAAVERKAARIDVEREPGGIGGGAERAVGGEAGRDRDNHRADDLDLRLAVEGEVLEVINGRLGRAGDAEREAAAAAGGEIAVGAGRHRILSHSTVEREVAQRGPVARALAGGGDRDADRAGGQRGRAHGGQRDGIGAAHDVAQRGGAVERDLVIGGRGAAGVVERAAVVGVAVEPHGRRAGHEQIPGDIRAAIERRALAEHLPHRALDTAVQRRRVADQRGAQILLREQK